MRYATWAELCPGERKLAPSEPSLCWDVKVGWVPVREIDPATGRCYLDGPGDVAPPSPEAT